MAKTPVRAAAKKSRTNSAKKTPKKRAAKKFVVEQILNKRFIGKKIEYLIKWMNYSHSDNTWEPAANCECPDLIEQYEREEKAKAAARKRIGSSHDTRYSAKRSRTETPRRSAGIIKFKPVKPTPATGVSVPASAAPRNRSSAPALASRRHRSSVPTLVSQVTPSSLFSTPDETRPNSTPAENEDNESIPPASATDEDNDKDDTNGRAVDSSSPDLKPVIETPCRTTIVHDGDELIQSDAANISLLPHQQKLIADAVDNLKMAEELLKCPDLFYVIISLGILKKKFEENHKDLWHEVELLNDAGNPDADAVAAITAKADETKKIRDEIETTLQNLHPSSRLNHVSSRQHTSPSEDNQETETESPTLEEVVKVEPSTPATGNTEQDETALDSTITVTSKTVVVGAKETDANHDDNEKLPDPLNKENLAGEQAKNADDQSMDTDEKVEEL